VRTIDLAFGRWDGIDFQIRHGIDFQLDASVISDRPTFQPETNADKRKAQQMPGSKAYRLQLAGGGADYRIACSAANFASDTVIRFSAIIFPSRSIS
jgi:hypothetical protein